MYSGIQEGTSPGSQASSAGLKNRKTMGHFKSPQRKGKVMNARNIQIATGNIKAAPSQVKYFGENNTPYCDFVVCCDRGFTKEDGADFIKVRLIGKHAENAVKFGATGRLVTVSGTHRQYTTEYNGAPFHVSFLETWQITFLTAPPKPSSGGDAPFAPFETEDLSEAPAKPTAKAAKPAAKAVKAAPAKAAKGKTISSFDPSDIPV